CSPAWWRSTRRAPRSAPKPVGPRSGCPSPRRRGSGCVPNRSHRSPGPASSWPGSTGTSSWDDKAMRVLVTGATGLLGHAVVAALAARGHEVVALSRTGSRVPEASAACVRGDIRQADTLASAVAGVEAVCHLAALARVRESLTDPLAYWQTNTVGTINLL